MKEKMGGSCATMGGKRNAQRLCRGNLKGKGHLEDLRHTQENNIKTILKTYSRRECTG